MHYLLWNVQGERGDASENPLYVLRVHAVCACEKQNVTVARGVCFILCSLYQNAMQLEVFSRHRSICDSSISVHSNLIALASLG